MPLAILAFGCMSVDEVIFREKKLPHLVLHNIWHILAFYIAYAAI